MRVTTLFLMLLAFPAAADEPTKREYWPSDGWRTARAETRGLDATKLAKLDDLSRKDRFTRAVLVIRGGHIVAEWYYEGATQTTRLGTGGIAAGVTSAMVGIAIGDKKLKSIDQKAAELLSDWEGDDTKGRITIEHLLTYASGLRWDRKSDWPKLRTMPDWAAHLGKLPVASKPGTTFRVTPIEPMLLSAVVGKATSQSLAAYAKEKLFTPLGIKATWTADDAGTTHGGTGLKTTARDLAKLGFLFLNKGVWDGKKVLSPEWVALSTRASRVSTSAGYLWRIWRSKKQVVYYAGGRSAYLYVLPGIDTVVVRLGSGKRGLAAGPFLKALAAAIKE